MLPMQREQRQVRLFDSAIDQTSELSGGRALVNHKQILLDSVPDPDLPLNA